MGKRIRSEGGEAIVRSLTALGLSDKESAVYMTLLEIGEAGPSEIAVQSGLKRPTAYLVLDSLEKRGAISRFQFGRREVFRAVGPQVLLGKLTSLTSLLGEQFDLFCRKSGAMYGGLQAQVFTGLDAIQSMWMDTLSSKTEILHLSEPGYARGIVQPDFGEAYRAQRIKSKIKTKIIAPFFKDMARLRSLGLSEYQKVYLELVRRDEKELREIRFLPEATFELGTDVTVYDNKVQMVSYYEQLGLLITSPIIARTQRVVFNLLFDMAGDFTLSLKLKASK